MNKGKRVAEPQLGEESARTRILALLYALIILSKR